MVKEDRQSEAIDNAGQHVARSVVRSKHVLGIRCAGGGAFDVIDGRIAVRDQWPEQPTLADRLAFDSSGLGLGNYGFGIVPTGLSDPCSDDQALDLDIAIDGFCS